MARYNIQSEITRLREAVASEVPEGVSFLLVLHDNKTGESRIAANLQRDAIPGALLSTALGADMDPKAVVSTSAEPAAH